jgi:alginate O-acetyltransferase complex protein AlgI
MLFNTWTFVAFLIPVWVLYYARPRLDWQIAVLIIASFTFYGWGEDPTGFARWKLIPLLAISCGINGWATRYLLDPERAIYDKRRILVFALVANLGILGFFKYAGLIVHSLLPASMTSNLSDWVLEIPLPVGISFYTFQGISLVVDAFRSGAIPGLHPKGTSVTTTSDGSLGVNAPQNSQNTRGTPSTSLFHARIWFFKSFFPQLVAGPIVKASQFFHQIEAKSIRSIDWDGAVKQLVAGFFFKMVVADNLKEATASISAPQFETLSSPTLLILLYAFSFQIFADFAGYSLIAQGLGKLFGYELPLNFNRPYLAASLTEFWRRWHLSLSAWLREYLYVPLGGNRKGELRTYFNLFIVMFLGGLWHGAAWSYAVWGTAHGIGLALERLLGVGRKSELSDWFPIRWLRVVIVFHVVSFLWLLFQLPDFSQALSYVRCLFTNPFGILPQYVFALLVFGVPVVIHHVWAGSENWRTRHLTPSWSFNMELLAYAIMLALVVINSGASGEFIYFQF